MTPTKDTPIGTKLRVINPFSVYGQGAIVTLTAVDGPYAYINGDDHKDRGWFLDRFVVVETPRASSLSAERLQLKAIRKAAAALYLEGKWELNDGTPPETQAKLWEDLRDALGFKPGFNTTVSAAA